MESKTRHLIEIFARHRVAANLLMAVMIVSGIWALLQINTQFLPNFSLNIITVDVVWRGANAEDVENSITNPIEQELRNLDYLKEITSISRNGVSTINLEFLQGTNMGDALNRVREQVSQVRSLPLDAERATISIRENFETVAKLIIWGPRYLQELRPLAYRIERQLLERGIAKVDITGLPKQQVAIQVPITHLAELNLSLNQIAQQINRLSRDLPAGTVGRGDLPQQLRSLEQQRDIKGFERLPLISTAPDRVIRIGDIANVSLIPRDQEVLVYYKGHPAVELNLLRTENANALKAANILKQWLSEARPRLGPSIHMHVYDQRWSLIKERINLLLKNGAGGLLLIIGILLLFLNARIAWWVILGIPVSFLAAIAALYGLGGSINMVTLFAMIMTLGIIVDDTIVVSEETQTQLSKGKSVLAAVEIGAKKMFVPISASSLTTICAFIPLFLVSGEIGTILFAIPLVVVCVILASLLECFLVLPGHLYHSLKAHSTSNSGRIRETLDNAFNHFRDFRFRRLVTFAVIHRWFTLALAGLLFLLALTLIAGGYVKFSFFPSPEGKLLYANIQFTAGTSPQKVQAFVKQAEQALYKTNQELSPKDENILNSSLVYYNQTAFNFGQGIQFGDQFAGIAAELTSPDSRRVTNQQFINAWRKNIKIPAGIENLSIFTPIAGPPGRDIDIRLDNQDYVKLKQAAIKLQEALKTYPGVSNIQDDIPFGQNQLIYELSPTGKAIGLTIEDIGRQLRAAFTGALAQIYHTVDDEIEVRVMLPKKQRQSLASLKQLPIIVPDGSLPPLDTVVNLKNRKGFDILRHTNTKSSIVITADVDTQVNNANEILASLQKSIIPQLKKDYSIQVNYTGRAEDQSETLHDMRYGLLLGLSLIYIILAWAFASYGRPFIIILAIPLGLTGAVFGHWLLGYDLTVLSLFGLFGLAGIVVNDSIILLSTYNNLRKKHTANEQVPIQETIIEAACMRLRAVILTSLTTIAGLTPLLFETSLQAQFLIPMAISISFGLMFSTLLILLVTPALLSIYEDGSRLIKQYFSSGV